MKDPLLGRTIDGRYEVLDRIGEGGTGIVYRARQVSVDRIIALKMLNQEMAQDPTWVQRFYNEARACSRLQHPNTIRLFDFGQSEDKHLYISMEFLRGQSLRQVIDTGAPLAAARVLKILVQCCASLTEAHGLGIIHRDIKPDNVFLLDMPGSPDFVKVLDFSVAKLLQDSEMRTQAGVVFGTPQYMPPEMGIGAVPDARSDIYSLGILAYEMATGAVPFSGENPIGVLQMHMTKPLPPLPARVAPPLAGVIRRALEKEPARRFASAAEMLEACQRELAAVTGGGAGRPTPAAAAGHPATAAEKTMFAAQAPAIAGQPPPMSPLARPLAPTLRPPGSGASPAAGPPPAQPPAGPPPAQPPAGPPPAQPPAGPPPAQPAVGPPPASADRSSQKTILAGKPPPMSQLSGPPNSAAATPPSASPAQKTMFAAKPPALPAGGAPAASPTAPADGAPPTPQPGAPAKTMMLENSEGIVSFARGDSSGPSPQAGAAAPTPGPAAASNAPTATRPRRGPSLNFWLMCLGGGLVLGLIAYLAVVIFGG